MTNYLFALVCILGGIGLLVAYKTGDMKIVVTAIELFAIALIIRSGERM